MAIAADETYVPSNFFRGALVASIVIPGHLIVYGFSAFNTNAATRFIQMFDSATVPADAAIPIMEWSLATVTGTAYPISFYPAGREFLEGLVLVNSSTSASKTIGSADSLFDVQFDVLTD